MAVTAVKPLKVQGHLTVETRDAHNECEDPVAVAVTDVHRVRLEFTRRKHAVRCPRSRCRDTLTDLFEGIRHLHEVHPGVDIAELVKEPFPIEAMVDFARIDVDNGDSEQVAVSIGFTGGTRRQRFRMVLSRERGLDGNAFVLKVPHPDHPGSPLKTTSTPGVYTISDG